MDANELMLKSALHYHREGLCVIPVVPGDKRPALPTWEHYQTTRSTEAEVREWFTAQPYNIGIIHGEVSGGYIAFDIDHDAGIFGKLRETWPLLFDGRVEQSGSGEGYHIPLVVSELPEFGSKTWKTPAGVVNIRVRNCQTVAPPSVHPSGQRYKFIQKGGLLSVAGIGGLIEWLDEIAVKPQIRRVVSDSRPALKPAGNDLVSAVKGEYGSVLQVFAEWGMASNVVPDKKDELRILGQGGLLVSADHQDWYCFADEVGGGVFEAWGWCKYGTGYDKRKHFRAVLLEMAEARNIDTTDYKKQGEVKPVVVPVGAMSWASQYGGYWGRLR